MGACRAQTHKAKGRPSLHSKHCLETVVKELSKATINSFLSLTIRLTENLGTSKAKC